MKQDPAHIAAHNQLAALVLSEGKVEVARKRLEEVLKTKPGSAELRLAIVGILTRQGAKPADIESWLVKSVEASAADASLRVALIDHQLEHRDANTAVETARAAIAALPDNPDVLDALGRALATSGDDLQAITSFNKVASLQPRSIAPYLRLVDLHTRRNNVPARTASLMKAFELAPESPLVHKQFIALVNQTKDPKSALGAAKDLQKRFPARASGYMLEGDIEAARKTWPAAIAAYRKALDQKDRPVQAPISAYVAYLGADKPADADRFAADWLKQHPKDSAFVAHLGSVAMSRKDYRLAEQRYAQVLSIDANDVLALNNVAWLMAERKAPEALAMAERAAKLAPGSALVQDTLAKALATAGKLDRAIEVQTQVTQMDGRRSAYKLNLAKLLIAAGDKAKAKAVLDAIVLTKDQSGAQAEAAALLKGLGV